MWQPLANGRRLVVDAGKWAEGVKPGDSLAHNGCCLTVKEVAGSSLSYDLLEETLRATNLGTLHQGDEVNLERSLAVGDRIGGHFVTGHVDSTVEVIRWEKEENGDYILALRLAAGAERYIVPKGCVALDGISLTVGNVEGGEFNVWIIPHTREVTTLKHRQAGDFLNIEYDMIAKYTEKLLSYRI